MGAHVSQEEEKAGQERPDFKQTRRGKALPGCEFAGAECYFGCQPAHCRLEHYCLASGHTVWCPTHTGTQRFNFNLDICALQLGSHDMLLSPAAHPIVELQFSVNGEEKLPPWPPVNVAESADVGSIKTKGGVRDPGGKGWRWNPPHRTTMMVSPSTKLRLFVHGDAAIATNASSDTAAFGSWFGFTVDPQERSLPFSSPWLRMGHDIMSQLHEPTDESLLFRSLPTPITVYYNGRSCGIVTVIFEAELPYHTPWLQIDCMGPGDRGPQQPANHDPKELRSSPTRGDPSIAHQGQSMVRDSMRVSGNTNGKDTAQEDPPQGVQDEAGGSGQNFQPSASQTRKSFTDHYASIRST